MSTPAHTPGRLTVGYGPNGLTGPTCPIMGASFCGGEDWPSIPLTIGQETIALIPAQDDGSGLPLSGSSEANAARLALAWNELARLQAGEATLAEIVKCDIRLPYGLLEQARQALSGTPPEPPPVVAGLVAALTDIQNSPEADTHLGLQAWARNVRKIARAALASAPGPA